MTFKLLAFQIWKILSSWNYRTSTFFLIKNSRIENFGPLGFSCDFYCNVHEKNAQTSTYCWAIIDLDLGTIRCRFFEASRWRAPWTSTTTLPLNCCGTCNAPIHPKFCAYDMKWPMVITCCTYDMTCVPDQEAK